MGLLVPGDKGSGAIFTEADLELLRTLTNQSAIAIANARVYYVLKETNAAWCTALRKVELLEHVKTHLGKFVPTSVLQIVERDPTAPALDKREQDVTVLFLDIVGYPSLSETLDQEKVNCGALFLQLSGRYLRQSRRHQTGEHVMDLGLAWCPSFYRDRAFAVAMSAGVGFWLGLWLCVPVHPITLAQVLSPIFLSIVILHPVLEELMFRGYLQGQLRQQSWGQQCWGGLTVANSLTSLLFVAGHCWSHPPLWAAAVLVPSLIFGYCRDRYASVYPCMVLHAFYNAGYFGLTGLP